MYVGCYLGSVYLAWRVLICWAYLAVCRESQIYPHARQQLALRCSFFRLLPSPEQRLECDKSYYKVVCCDAKPVVTHDSTLAAAMLWRVVQNAEMVKAVAPTLRVGCT